jgi:hypothetical protein
MKLFTIPFLILFSFQIKANTVNDFDYLNKKIENLKENSDYNYDEIETLFEENPIFTVNCFESEKESPKDFEEKLDTFSEADKLSFQLTKSGPYGFNIFAELVGVPVSQLIAPNEILSCSSSASGCSSLTFKSTQKTTVMINDDLREAEVSSDWRIYIASDSWLLAELSTVLSYPETDFWGRDRGSETIRKESLCSLKIERAI